MKFIYTTKKKYQSNIPKCFKDETVTLLFAKPKAVCVNKTFKISFPYFRQAWQVSKYDHCLIKEVQAVSLYCM